MLAFYIAMGVLLALAAVAVALGPMRVMRQRERQRDEAFQWCVKELGRRNYYAYWLAQDYAHRFSPAQRAKLMTIVEAQLSQEEKQSGMESLPLPPASLLQQARLIPPGETARRVIPTPGLRFVARDCAAELQRVLREAKDK
jgi:hypothetical protein